MKENSIKTARNAANSFSEVSVTLKQKLDKNTTTKDNCRANPLVNINTNICQ
jgi:hypothetical protein